MYHVLGKMSKKFFITTAIAYINSPPHIGFAYEVIGADIMARFHRMKGEKVFFLTGSDEHSVNVVRKAKEKGVSPEEYCNKMSGVYKETWKSLGITYDKFIRTNSKEHEKVVIDFVKKLLKTNFVNRKKYSGWYCLSCESFYKEKELKDGLCPIHLKKPEWIEEENFFFKLSKFQNFLEKYISENPEFIKPEERKNEVLGILREGLQDISISRKETPWGIPFPTKKEEKVYVWIDALINYISGLGENFKDFWPPDYHIIGKDIIRFHCIIWPALLKALNLPLPKKIFSHGFINLKGEKVSSTKGNILQPKEILKEYPPDAVRFYLFREIPFGVDGDFSLEGLRERYNQELANDWGNLVRRVEIMTEKYFSSSIPELYYLSPIEKEIVNFSDKVWEKTSSFMENFEFSKAIHEIWKLVKRTNQYVEESAPWNIHKRGDKEKLSTVIYTALELLRKIALLLYPFTPFSSSSILRDINFEKITWEEGGKWDRLPHGKKIHISPPLFLKK